MRSVLGDRHLGAALAATGTVQKQSQCQTSRYYHQEPANASRKLLVLNGLRSSALKTATGPNDGITPPRFVRFALGKAIFSWLEVPATAIPRKARPPRCCRARSFHYLHFPMAKIQTTLRDYLFLEAMNPDGLTGRFRYPTTECKQWGDAAWDTPRKAGSLFRLFLKSPRPFLRAYVMTKTRTEKG